LISRQERLMQKRTIMAAALVATCYINIASSINALGQPVIPGAFPYKLSTPVTSGNLTVFFIRGKSILRNQNIMTLQEALAQKKVIVKETGDVNNLAVENLSDALVFIQSGDILKGGRQDRTMQFDMLLPPHSGLKPLPAFCVEHGRWSRRGSE